MESGSIFRPVIVFVILLVISAVVLARSYQTSTYDWRFYAAAVSAVGSLAFIVLGLRSRSNPES